MSIIYIFYSYFNSLHFYSQNLLTLEFSSLQHVIFQYREISGLSISNYAHKLEVFFCYALPF